MSDDGKNPDRPEKLEEEAVTMRPDDAEHVIPADNFDDDDVIDMETVGSETVGAEAMRGGMDTGLSAKPVGGMSDDGDDDFDADPDIDFDSGSDFDAPPPPPKSGKGGGSATKLLAPVLVLVVAAGVGGYIVMNPDLFAPDKAVNQANQAYDASAMFQQDDVASITEDLNKDAPPQPTTSVNQVPREPEVDMAAQDMENIDESFAMAEAVTPDSWQPPEEQGSADGTSGIDDNPFGQMDAAMAEVEAAAEQDMAAKPAELDDIPLLGDASMDDDLDSLVGQETDGAVMVDFGQAEQAASEENAAEAIAEDLAESVASVETSAPAVEEVAVSMPDIEDELQSAMSGEQDAAGLLPEPDFSDRTFQMAQAEQPAAAPAASGGDTSAAAGLSKEKVEPVVNAPKGSNSYYDGTLNVPSGPMSDAYGPRMSDPVTEPATEFVVVKKNYDKTDQESLIVSANRALKLGRYDAALEMYEQLYKKNKRDERILMGRAVAQQNMGLTESAIRSYEETLDINGRNADAMVNMLGLIREQYPAVALRRLMDLQAKYPSNAGIAAQIGITQADLGQPQEAIRYLGMASSLEPNNAQHIFNMAIVADKMGSTREAIQHYERALQVDSVYGKGRALPRDTIYDRLSALRRRL